MKLQKYRWLLIGLAAGVFIATTIWTLLVSQPKTPTDSSAEAGFSRDMGDHHQQAVDMAFIIRDKSADQPIKIVAFDIINTQATQRGIMMGWLEQWELTPTTTRPALEWADDDKANGMEHGSMESGGQMQHDSGMMPGMASVPEIDKLRSLNGKEADILFMQLMIRHHNGGITMAKDLLERSQRQEVRWLAQKIVDSQQVEIDSLTSMLNERGAKP